jgi:hypothetical protein|nr:MAG TPA: hypothetical protein [Caudoviricetes sp.]
MKRFVKWFLFLCALLVIIFTADIIFPFVAGLIVGTTDSALSAVVCVLLISLVAAAIASKIEGES